METDIIINYEIMVLLAIGGIVLIVSAVALVKETWFNKKKNEKVDL